MKTYLLAFILTIFVAQFLSSCNDDLPSPKLSDPTVMTEDRIFDHFYTSPNPFVSNTTFKFEMLKAGYVSLIVSSADNNEILVVESGIMEKGKHSIEFNGAFLANGKYSAQIRSKSDEVGIVLNKVNSSK